MCSVKMFFDISVILRRKTSEAIRVNLLEDET